MKFTKKLVTFFLALFILLVSPAQCFAQETENKPLVEENAKSAILMCMDTGEIIYENNAYEHLSPASVTKIMSMLLFFEAIDNGKIKLTDSVVASETAEKMGGSQIWLEVGEQMTVDELLKAIVIASANDACTALGEHIAGSDIGFVKMMNDRASELGLKDSCFENCTGLDDTTKNHYSCAYDLAVIACELMKHKKVTDYTSVWLDYLRGGKTELNNTNKLINKYQGITGLKTGTTSNAGFCLCATAQRDGMNLVAVVLGCETSDDRFNSARNLLDFGFANYEIIVPEIDENQITQVNVKAGREKFIKPTNDFSEKIMVKKGSGDITYKYDIAKNIQAPVMKNDKLGSITIFSGEKEIKVISLKADKDIEKVTFSYIFNKILCNI